MKYIIKEKLPTRIFRGWNEFGSLVLTESLADATVYDAHDDAQTILDKNHKQTNNLASGTELENYEIVEITEKELFLAKLKGI